jgi:hypothetical protein
VATAAQDTSSGGETDDECMTLNVHARLQVPTQQFLALNSAAAAVTAMHYSPLSLSIEPQ